jgi:hypothetical protein
MGEEQPRWQPGGCPIVEWDELQKQLGLGGLATQAARETAIDASS